MLTWLCGENRYESRYANNCFVINNVAYFKTAAHMVREKGP